MPGKPMFEVNSINGTGIFASKYGLNEIGIGNGKSMPSIEASSPVNWDIADSCYAALSMVCILPNREGMGGSFSPTLNGSLIKSNLIGDTTISGTLSRTFEKGKMFSYGKQT
jgi:hypothetical protein